MFVDIITAARILRSCATYESLCHGMRLHLYLIKSGQDTGLFIHNCLLQMYVKCGSTGDAHQFFHQMPQRNTFSFNTLIEGYIKSSDLNSAIQIFNTMPMRNTFTWNSIIHSLTKCGRVAEGRVLYQSMPERDPSSLNALMNGFLCHGHPKEALDVFQESQSMTGMRSDPFVLATILTICSELLALYLGKQVHSQIIAGGLVFDSVLSSSLVNMYSKCREMDGACRAFEAMIEPDEYALTALISGYANCGKLDESRLLFVRVRKPSSVMWNSIIAGCVRNNREREALQLFIDMKREGMKPEAATFTSSLSACASMGDHKLGQELHAHAYKMGLAHDIIVSSSLVDMYAKSGLSQNACVLFSELDKPDTVLLNSMITAYSNCGRVDMALQIFKTMPKRSLISWNAMVVGYSQNGYAIEALELFHKMQILDLRMDEITLASASSSCAKVCSISLGEQIHARAVVVGLDRDAIIGSSLIDLYCKCGDIEDARCLFEGLPTFDEVPWNAMITGYAHHGYVSQVLQLFYEMRNMGVKPNGVTFIGVLSSCSHGGLVDEGRRWYDVMRYGYGIEPVAEHYACMVDMYARAGLLKEAEDFIDGMPFEADEFMWSSVLNACKNHGDEALAKKATERLLRINPGNSGAYVQLSGMYAACGEWDKAVEVRRMMHDSGIRKSPGLSWINSLKEMSV
ncbi:putative pentatricopeptide repeat-containing protein At1g77010, mitochondrial [Amborella trichopoda]|uniref:Pentacotripeptide-repeat region of PRORP domain-containing protein n=1 Tax=Amborella trichopoda TaxID=13333 RepID=W1PZ55_AMBTC|nr:putative pentatricopeptide repeat-containing protein At1g77010, mitochondrial [Amborella trichopoda]ERN13648.1 hypothetical protein AMTR_s00049p00103660 [Amborella trichopoda]|eukprot:XP_006852181.1 putative pentatricopeptide repeat-containing protein At1g77010, mitochondrial [Amborella trichopoda]